MPWRASRDCIRGLQRPYFRSTITGQVGTKMENISKRDYFFAAAVQGLYAARDKVMDEKSIAVVVSYASQIAAEMVRVSDELLKLAESRDQH